MAQRLATVFGGSGFIGRQIVQRLAAAGWRVRVAARDTELSALLRPRGDVGQVVPVAADITHAKSVELAVAGADLVVNAVGILSPWGKSTFDSIHVTGAATVAKAAKAAGVARLVHLSALGASKDGPSDYARSKAAGEEAVRAAFPSATILRPSVVFGPDDDFFNRFATLAAKSPVLPVITGMWPKPIIDLPNGKVDVDFFGKGGAIFQPVYVDDVASAVLVAADTAAAAGQTYSLGGPRRLSLKDAMELSAKHAGKSPLVVPLPPCMTAITAFIMGLLPLPKKPLTSDQVKQMKVDNVVPDGAPGLDALGIVPTDVAVILPTYLSRFSNPYVHRHPAL